MSLPNTSVVLNPRMGGQVKRYHTWPTIQQQDVGNHTFHVLRIYFMIFGDIPPEVTNYIVFHDIPEVHVGDPPHPTKANNPDLKAWYDTAEHEVLGKMLGEGMADHIDNSVTDYERVQMKVADLIEMGEFAMVEKCLGSQFADAILVNVRIGLDRVLPGLSVEHQRAAIAHFTTELTRYNLV